MWKKRRTEHNTEYDTFSIVLRLYSGYIPIANLELFTQMRIFRQFIAMTLTIATFQPIINEYRMNYDKPVQILQIILQMEIP